MDKVALKALELACGLRIDAGPLPSRPATVDEIVSAAGRYAAFLRGETVHITSGTGYTDPPPINMFPPAPRIPAVPKNESIHDHYIVCLDDGVKLKMMKRHITALGYTPESYRAFWGLPGDYPMTAPAYAKKRSQLAKEIGLGTQATTPRRKADAR